MSKSHIQQILGMNVAEFRGCGACPVAGKCPSELKDDIVTLRHIGDERWDNWGRLVRVFGDNDEVNASIRHDGKIIYCASAESTWYPGVRDYIHLKNFSWSSGVQEDA